MYCPIYWLKIQTLSMRLKRMQTDSSLLFPSDTLRPSPVIAFFVDPSAVCVLAGQTCVKMYTKTTTSRLRTVATIPTMPSVCSRPILHRPVSPTLSSICKIQREHSSFHWIHTRFSDLKTSPPREGAIDKDFTTQSDASSLNLFCHFKATQMPKILTCDVEYYYTY